MGVKTRVIAFAAVFAALYAGAAVFFKPLADAVAIIYYEPRETVDVLFLGSSHTHCGVNPNVIWREEGVAAYNYTGPGQPLWRTRNYFIEALKTQKPYVIVLDVVYAFRGFENGYDTFFNEYNSLKPSLNFLDMVISGALPEQRAKLILCLPFFHTRWRDINENSTFYTKEDYMAKSDRRYKGYLLYSQFLAVADIDPSLNDAAYPSTDERAELPEKNAYYLKEIIELSKERGVNLLLIKTPTAMPFNNEYEQKAYNTVRDIAGESEIAFINYNEKRHRDAMGFDFTTDLFDEGHLNATGAEKFSKYIGAHLKSEYALPDRRGDIKYETYDESARGYFLYEAEERVKLNTDIVP